MSTNAMHSNELMRLASFARLSSEFPSFSTSRLAQHGFYATSVGSEIQCFSCGFSYNALDQGDPIILHDQQQCPFLLESGFKSQSEQPGDTHLNPQNFVLSDSATANNFLQLNGQVNGIQHSDTRSQSPADVTQMSTQQNYRMFPQSDSAPEVNSRNVISNGINVPETLTSNNRSQENGGNHANAVRRRIGYNDNRLEICRLETFRQWPSNASVRPDDLANSGFYYLGTDDRVQCAFCRGILRNWEADDRPLAEHLRHFPQCPFLSDPAGAGNIKLGDEDESIFGNVELRLDVTGNMGPLVAPPVGIMTERPQMERFAPPAERIGTYKTYPSNSCQRPEELTRAGFYYTNMTDTVKCFFCGVMIKNWKPNDDPWVIHAKMSPRCGYIIMCKGEDFIEDVQQNRRTNYTERKQGLRKKRKKERRRRITAEELERAMTSKVVDLVLGMGQPQEVVKTVVKRRLQELDEPFPNAESLLDECTEFSDSRAELTSSSESDMETDVVETEPGAAGYASNFLETESKSMNQEDFLGGTTDENSLIEENQKLKEERQCKVCLDEIATIVFLKCGHLVCCSNCAPAMKHCPVCREPILGTIKVDTGN